MRRKRRKLSGKGPSAKTLGVFIRWIRRVSATGNTPTRVCVGGGTATRCSCFWRKYSRSRREPTDRGLFYLQIHRTHHPASLRITGILLLRIPGKSFILPHNATIPAPRFPGLIPTFAPQKQPEKQLANNINGEQPPLFFSRSLRHTPAPIRGIRVKERCCCCCIFNGAARFNPALTFKAQGLIPALVKAFV